MPEFKLVDVTEGPYLYVSKACSMDPTDISGAMGAAFQQVWSFLQSEGIKPAGAALSVYYGYDPDSMSFRAGFTVHKKDLAKAKGEVSGDVTPAGEVLYFQHKGSYATLRDSYALMMEHIAQMGREVSAPTWESYLNDPSQVGEDELLTDVFVTLK